MLNLKNFVYHYSLDEENMDFVMNVPYYEKVIKINGKDFRKIFIIDIRGLNRCEEIFENFDNFQTQLLADEYYSLPRDTQYPIILSLYFLNDSNKLVNPGRILHNYNYALKNFIDSEEFNKIMDQEDNLIVPNRNSSYIYDEKKIQTSNFNLLYGLNGSGKTLFLKYISSKNDIPLFMLNQKYDDKEKLLSSSSQYLENLSHIVNYCHTRNIPLLLDDLSWYSFDGRNQIKIIDTLYEYSHYNDVFFTSSQDNIKQLVKRRSQNPNIINFKR